MFINCHQFPAGHVVSSLNSGHVPHLTGSMLGCVSKATYLCSHNIANHGSIYSRGLPLLGISNAFETSADVEKMLKSINIVNVHICIIISR